MVENTIRSTNIWANSFYHERSLYVGIPVETIFVRDVKVYQRVVGLEHFEQLQEHFGFGADLLQVQTHEF